MSLGDSKPRESIESSCLDLLGEGTAGQQSTRLLRGESATDVISDSPAHGVARLASLGEVGDGDLAQEPRALFHLRHERAVLGGLASELGLAQSIRGFGGPLRRLGSVA